MAVKDQIKRAYSLLTDESNDPEGVHIHFTEEDGTEIGILEFMDSETVYVERYNADGTSDVRNVSDMSETEFVQFVTQILAM